MDISSVSSIASAASQAQIGEAVSIAVLKKAIDLQAQGALQLIDALRNRRPTARPISARASIPSPERIGRMNSALHGFAAAHP